MKKLTLAEICRAVAGTLVQGDENAGFDNVSTDTRTLRPGDLFVALQGENHDAHRYLDRAITAGAGGLVVQRYAGETQIPVIRVADTLKALQDIARYNRRRFTVPVIGITGSSGKTTTKDMLASVLARKFPVLKTRGNYNNQVGLPLTLLQMDERHRSAVLEMAMRGPGEIDLLAGIAEPTGAIITNVGEAHLERLGSVENIARAKAELLDHVPENGFAVLHRESPYLAGEASRCRGKMIFFGPPGSDVYARDVFREGAGNRFTIVYYGETAQLYIPVPGLHNVQNALAAAAVGRELGLSWEDIANGLSRVAFSAMRMEISRVGGVTVINDAYNANPDSTGAALAALRETAGPARTVAVLGDMLELGSGAREAHHRVGETVVRHGIHHLITVGDLAGCIAEGALSAGMTGERVFQCRSNPRAVARLKEILCPGDVVLVKGSRGMKMEETVDGLISNLRARGGDSGAVDS